MFKIKQKVVCVLQFPPRPEKMPVVGEIYTVRDVVDNDAIRLEEIVNKRKHYLLDGFMEVCFMAIGFRPVDETFGAETVEKLEKILQPDEKEIFI